MKIKVKSLKQIENTLEIASNEITIKDLKNEIEQKLNFDSDQLKLLYKGAVLDDSKKLKEYNILEETVLIMVNAKIKLKNAPLLNKKEDEKKEPEKKEEIINPEYEQKIQNLMGMGFDREIVKKAIIAAKGNEDTAIEYCLSGIPPALQNVNRGNHVGGDALKKIASVTKCICHDNPSSLGPFLQNLGENAPELLNLIRDKEEEFKNMIDTPVNKEDLRILNEYTEEIGLSGLRQGKVNSGSNNLRGNSGVHSGGLPLPVGGNSGGNSGSHPNGGSEDNSNQGNKFTEEEKAAISRLMELGFSEEVATLAYVACQKNEEQAGNYLFENNIG